MASFTVMDAQSRLCFEQDGESRNLIVRDADGRMTRFPLTAAHMRQLGYHGALAYKEMTGADCLMPPPFIAPGADIAAEVVPPAPRVRVRTIGR